MKTTLMTILMLAGLSANAAQSNSIKDFKFVFQSGKQSFELKKTAPTKDLAFKLAAKECYQRLTGGKYPGEERGLDIIDICANPKM
ncbi:MAG: hypothetical protein A2622_11960 [Bdellovibrionales bacterium RIFCSPHIGHO2_01_FULL_40_29]|nr:MAG: hypothetical protein A2622_11960 [Bdellovibrionales bacterium RIFCSPHIGHO2_01_FULL_40_29]OFZ35620.1 MAG: hypothetical protein A3D17_00580 [Bdellovibrionales bacterium RIFCSPHIGHO2_02_FULL_40_15]